jgi:hypothetical protein
VAFVRGFSVAPSHIVPSSARRFQLRPLFHQRVPLRRCIFVALKHQGGLPWFRSFFFLLDFLGQIEIWGVSR